MLNGQRVIIPNKLQKLILQKIHEGHQGIVKCKRRARQTVYWPNFNEDIELMLKKCTQCIANQRSNSKDPLMPHEVPEAPWEKLGTDLFHYGGKDYFLIVDYYSLWPEVYVLSRATSAEVIAVTKDAFARHGIPKMVISDNGPQYSSKQYRQFAREWEFEHRTSSPRYPRSNGLAESTVKTIKNLIKKCQQSQGDIYKGLLAYRNTPLACGSSPAELLHDHSLQDNLPTLHRQQRYHHRPINYERKIAKQQHDKTPNRLPTNFYPNQLVAIQTENGDWTLRGRIIREVEPRSYEIKLDNGRLLRRNQVHLRKLYTLFAGASPGGRDLKGATSDSTTEVSTNNSDSNCDSDSDTIPYMGESDEYITRSGRRVKRKQMFDL